MMAAVVTVCSSLSFELLCSRRGSFLLCIVILFDALDVSQYKNSNDSVTGRQSRCACVSSCIHPALLSVVTLYFQR